MPTPMGAVTYREWQAAPPQLLKRMDAAKSALRRDSRALALDGLIRQLGQAARRLGRPYASSAVAGQEVEDQLGRCLHILSGSRSEQFRTGAP